MKKKQQTAARVVLTTAIAALPLALASSLQAQVTNPARPRVGGTELRTVVGGVFKFAERFHKESSHYALVGIDNGNTIYQNARNERFYLDPATGDMKFLATDMYIKFRESPAKASTGIVGPASTGTALKLMKWPAERFGGEVTILGLDQAGHVVQQNARGEKFYLNPNTGDMVFVR